MGGIEYHQRVEERGCGVTQARQHVPPPRPPLIRRCRLLLPATRPTHLDERCHEIGFTYITKKQLQGNERAAEEQGRAVCSQQVGRDWTWVRTEMDVPWDGDLTWKAYCRRCGLPGNAVLMWQVATWQEQQRAVPGCAGTPGTASPATHVLFSVARGALPELDIPCRMLRLLQVWDCSTLLRQVRPGAERA